MGKRDLKGPKGEYKKSCLYSFAFMVATVDACLITRNYFLSEGVRFGSDTKNGGWDILSVFPIRQFD